MNNPVLARVRQAVRNPLLTGDRPAPPAAPAPQPFEPAALVERFRAEVEALTGKVYGPLAPEAALAQLAALVQAEPGVLAWDDAELPIPGTHARLAAAGIPVHRPHTGTPEDWLALRQLRVGISGVSAALADTGSLVVTSAPGRPRSVSLLPPVYVAMVRISDLYPDLATWMSLHGATVLDGSTNVTIITGPSRTADIEFTLVVGVHGPGEIHVVLVDC